MSKCHCFEAVFSFKSNEICCRHHMTKSLNLQQGQHHRGHISASNMRLKIDYTLTSLFTHFFPYEIKIRCGLTVPYLTYFQIRENCLNAHNKPSKSLL